MIKEIIEQHLNKQLQKSVTFQINGKTIKKGKLILFSIRNFHLQFLLKIGKSEKKHYELPYPFNCTVVNGNLNMDYTLNALTHNNPELLYKLLGLTRHKQSKIYNSVIVIKEEETK